MNKLVSIGELLIDFSSVGIGSLKQIQQFVKNAGGAPANVCVQAAKLGQRAVYLTQVGMDGFGEFLIETLRNMGVDTSYIKKNSAYETSLAFVSFQENGEREFSFYRSNAADLYFTQKDFEGIEFSDGDILEFGSVALKTKEARETHLDLIFRAKKNNAIICFDPNVRVNLWEDLSKLKGVIQEFLQYADIVKLGDEELKFLTNCEEIEQGVNQLWTPNLKLLIVTKGERGANLYLSNQKKFMHAGFSVQAVDTTGAGDSFFGGFLSELLRKEIKTQDLLNQDYEDILAFACQCGAYTTTGYGAIPAMGNKKQVESVGKSNGNSKISKGK